MPVGGNTLRGNEDNQSSSKEQSTEKKGRLRHDDRGKLSKAVKSLKFFPTCELHR